MMTFFLLCFVNPFLQFYAPQTKILKIETNDLVSLFEVLFNESLKSTSKRHAPSFVPSFKIFVCCHSHCYAS